MLGLIWSHESFCASKTTSSSSAVLQLHGKALLEEGVRVASAAAEADHGILLIRLVLLAADQALVPLY